MARKRRKYKDLASRWIIQKAGNPATLEEAVETVVKGLMKDVSCPPTDLPAIFPKLRVKMCEVVEDLPVSGELRRDGDMLVIVHSPHLSIPRKRFTIAHELGHAFYESTGPNCPKKGKYLERICDMIASEILLPRDKIVPYFQRCPSFLDLQNIAKTFLASISATAIGLSRFFQISYFEMESGSIVFGIGAASGKYPIDPDMAFKNAVKRGMEGESGKDMVMLDQKNSLSEWHMEWISIGNKRALFYLVPMAYVR